MSVVIPAIEQAESEVPARETVTIPLPVTPVPVPVVAIIVAPTFVPTVGRASLFHTRSRMAVTGIVTVAGTGFLAFMLRTGLPFTGGGRRGLTTFLALLGVWLSLTVAGLGAVLGTYPGCDEA
jgi:hypothetical protein